MKLILAVLFVNWLPWVDAPHDKRILAYCEGLVYGAPVSWMGIVYWWDGFKKWPETRGWQGVPIDTPACTHWIEAPTPPIKSSDAVFIELDNVYH